MMSSSRSGAPRMGPRRGGKKSGSFQMILFLVVAILVVVLIAVVAFGGKKGGTTRARREKKSRATTVAQTGERATRPTRVKSTRVRSEREVRRRLTREERTTLRKERARKERETGRVTVRSSRGGYTAKRSTKPVLKAIIAEPSGGRVAVIGERRVKAGDQIEGRRITEVGPDKVKVEYFTKTYEVKINQPLY